jgi:DNA-binding NtrC family response regulator
MLRQAGVDVVHAANANQALRYLETSVEPLDAVLSDIAMPGAMNGIALAFELRRRRPELPVLLTTGYADQLDEATRGGFNVVPKPAPAAQLIGELRAMMRQRRQPQGLAGDAI